MFAGGASVLITKNNYEWLQHMFNAVLLHMSKWFKANQLVLNVDKTHSVTFTLSKFSYCLLHLTYVN